MPDIQTLIYLSEFYNVELIEILNGERKREIMNEEVKDTSLKVSEYENVNKKRTMKYFRALFLIAIAGKSIGYLLGNLYPNSNPVDFYIGFFEGITLALMFLGVLLTLDVFDKYNIKKQKFLKEKFGMKF